MILRDLGSDDRGSNARVSLSGVKVEEWGSKTYMLGFLTHAIRDALLEALEILMDIPLIFE